jgi:hypothetical protein
LSHYDVAIIDECLNVPFLFPKMSQADLVDISKKSTRELLVEYGDVLEQKIFADEIFFKEFRVYGEIWARYILPNREVNSPTLTTPCWREFAASHYSAIVRCWTVRASAVEICHACENIINNDETALSLLSIHGRLLTFFTAIGAAHDNMQRCFKVWPIETSGAFDACGGNPREPFSLAWLYDRRTQAVHSALVPINNGDGTFSVDMSLFKDKATNWAEADWRDQEGIAEIVSAANHGFHSGMSRCWSKLKDIFQNKMPADKPNAIESGKLWPSFGSGNGMRYDPSKKNQLPFKSPLT